MQPGGLKCTYRSSSSSLKDYGSIPGKAEPQAGDNSSRVFTGDPNISQLPRHSPGSMSSADTAGAPIGSTFTAMFNAGSGGFSSLYKAGAGQRRRPGREASSGAAAAVSAFSARQMPRKPLASTALPDMLFDGGSPQGDARPAQRPNSGSPSAAGTAPGFRVSIGTEQRTSAGAGMDQGTTSIAQQGVGRRTSFLFTSSPPVAAKHAPVTPPLRPGPQPVSPEQAPGFSFSSLPTARPETPPAAKRRTPSETEGLSGTPPSWPPFSSGFSEPLLSRQFAGVQLNGSVTGAPAGMGQSLSSKLREASIGVPPSEAMATRFAEQVTLGAHAAGGGPQPSHGITSVAHHPVTTPERPRAFGSAVAGVAEAKTPSLFTPAVSMFTPGNTPVTGTARRGSRRAEPPSRRTFGGMAGGGSFSFAEFGKANGGFSFSTPAPVAGQASKAGTPMEYSPMDCSPYPHPAESQPEIIKPHSTAATGSGPATLPNGQPEARSTVSEGLSGRTNDGDRVTVSVDKGTAAGAAASVAAQDSGPPFSRDAARAPAAREPVRGNGKAATDQRAGDEKAGKAFYGGRTTQRGFHEESSSQQSAAQADPAPTFSAEFVAKLSMEGASAGQAASFAFGAAAQQPSTEQGPAVRTRSTRPVQSGARATPAAAVPPVQPLKAAAAASSQWIPQQPAPSAPPAFRSFTASGGAPPGSFVFGGPATAPIPASAAAADQPPAKLTSDAATDANLNFGAAMSGGTATLQPAAQMRLPRRVVHVRVRTSPSRAAQGVYPPTVPARRAHSSQQPAGVAPASTPAPATNSSFSLHEAGTRGSHATAAAATAAWPPLPPSPPQRASIGAKDLRAARLEIVDQQAKAAFRTRSYRQAELCYSEAVGLVRELGDRAELVKQLNNRAAARLMLRRTEDALADCEAALQLHPGNSRAAVRASSCHVRLGDFDAAVMVLGATAEIQLSAELSAQIKEVAALQAAFAQTEARALTGGQEAVAAALGQLKAIMDQQGPSARLLLLLAHALLRLGRGDEAVSLVAAQQQAQLVVHWGWWPSVQLAWQQGNHQQASQILRSSYVDSPRAVAGAVRVPTEAELQPLLVQLAAVDALKQKGNELLKSGSHSEACEQYTAALAASVGGGGPVAPPAVVAVLHCNRAAAYQALGQLPEAIADCSRARALNANYVKAHSRMAALLTEVGRPDAAATALEGMGALPALSPAERRDQVARLRVAISACSGKAPPANHYKLMGLPQTCNQDEVRKAYKKMALRFHPDKALANCRFAERLGEHGAPLAEARVIEERIRCEADWLFKCIGEAHSVLSDTVQRGEFNVELRAQKAAAASRKSPSTHWSWRTNTASATAGAPRSASYSGGRTSPAAKGGGTTYRASDGYSNGASSTFGARRGGSASSQRPGGTRPAPSPGKPYGARVEVESDESESEDWDKSYWSTF